ncbi:uncharacterized protein K452DRAFT_275814 [Aplosporella prunicola CBS 121167]|uniref:Subtilisin-like serine protease n=1 Tax=Aplosporella prunicola CBS 121167 TaxID=1176127 RepID=A0A6A6B3W7_9PEZI|nr:uncharacterized protein K452DRAFT_275814 [Aplosporella prunicola CBS 121167]KAF2138912.1 hypothetical protein K452DRAFT_275814 [Aplosporella prunicola CBS 121167]
MGSRRAAGDFAPFKKDTQLCDDLDDCEITSAGGVIKPLRATIPGRPCAFLNDFGGVERFLYQEFVAPDLEDIAPHLWILSTQSSSNINSLHRQKIKGREIVVTEDPRLHLVWIHDRIFIKPLPKYILSHAFWKMFFSKQSFRIKENRETILQATKGYLRTYRYLICHESDFLIAKQDHLRLIPPDVEWEVFCRFIAEIEKIRDEDVSKRYLYGELRLSRLNLYAPLLLHKFYYEQVYGQYADYFARLYGPILFVFAIATTILNGMQVELAVEESLPQHWNSFWPVCRGFSMLSLVGTALIALAFALLWLWMFIDEWLYAIRHRWKGNKSHNTLDC